MYQAERIIPIPSLVLRTSRRYALELKRCAVELGFPEWSLHPSFKGNSASPPRFLARPGRGVVVVSRISFALWFELGGTHHWLKRGDGSSHLLVLQ
jgi:predicted TIM-barrel fold metal-dependent hydrolase